MDDSIRESLPRIKVRLSTEGRSASYRANSIRKFTFSLKDNEYLKNWLNQEKESRKMQAILKENHKEKPYWRRQAIKTISKTMLALKHEEQHLTSSNEKTTTLNPQVIEIYYNLELRHKQAGRQQMIVFKQWLEENNSFFNRLSPVISESLLQVGSITTYQPKEFVYKENFPVKTIGILLWGQGVLKHKYKESKDKYKLLPGDTIGEQLIFEDVEYSSKKYSTVQKGELCANERCKAVKSSAILFIGEQQFRCMEEDMTKEGCKEEMMRFKSILQSNYLRKRDFRSIMF